MKPQIARTNPRTAVMKVLRITMSPGTTLMNLRRIMTSVRLNDSWLSLELGLEGFRLPARRKRWRCRSMAKQAGVSKASVQRIWAANDLKPHRTRTFKLSNDPDFEAKFWESRILTLQIS